jgi:hypothetical protein
MVNVMRLDSRFARRALSTIGNWDTQCENQKIAKRQQTSSDEQAKGWDSGRSPVAQRENNVTGGIMNTNNPQTTL